MNEAIRMQLSAYVDGELPQNEAELLLRRMSQDVELRQEVAEYLAIGRVMRGEAGVAGVDSIHDRVLAEIDHRIDVDSAAGVVEPPARAIKPLLGVAVAATVALVAIFFLQQTTSVDRVEPQEAVTTVVDAVPDYSPEQDQLRQYLLSHGETSSQLGANGINSRLVTLRFSSEVAAEPDDADDADDTGETAAQP